MPKASLYSHKTTHSQQILELNSSKKKWKKKDHSIKTTSKNDEKNTLYYSWKRVLFRLELWTILHWGHKKVQKNFSQNKRRAQTLQNQKELGKVSFFQVCIIRIYFPYGWIFRWEGAIWRSIKLFSLQKWHGHQKKRFLGDWMRCWTQFSALHAKIQPR